MAANAQDDIVGDELPFVHPVDQQSDEVLDLVRDESQQLTVHPEPVQVSCLEANLGRPVYLPSGRGVSRREEIEHLEEEISKLEKRLQRERDDHMEEVEAIKKELSKIEQELRAARSQLQQFGAKDIQRSDQLRAKEAEVRVMEEQLRAKDTELRAKDEQVKAKEEQVKAKDILQQAKDERIKAKDEQLKVKDEKLSTKDEQLKLKDQQLCAKDEELKSTIAQLQAKYDKLSEQQKAKDNDANSRIEELEREKSQLEKELKSKKDEILKLKKECSATDEIARSLQANVAIGGAESQITTSTSNTGVSICLPPNRNNGSVATCIASQSATDPNQVVLAGPCISFWKNKELGRGAFATVYEGVFNNEHCAVKILNQVAMHLISDLPTGPCDDPIQRKAIQSFTRECSCLMTINHPNIVKLIDVRTYDKGNFPVLVMERLDCSLTDYFRRQDGPNQNMSHLHVVLLSICCDIASALDYLHENRIVHRDICGNNILLVLDRDHSVQKAKISDFGMSRILKDFEKMSTTLTAIEGHRAAYYPPELQDDCGSSDSSIDIYMFGVVMLQIAHGIPCVTSRRERNGLIQKLSGFHVLKSSILLCTESEKNKRPSARDLHESIKSLLEQHREKVELKNNPQESNTN